VHAAESFAEGGERVKQTCESLAVDCRNSAPPFWACSFRPSHDACASAHSILGWFLPFLHHCMCCHRYSPSPRKIAPKEFRIDLSSNNLSIRAGDAEFPSTDRNWSRSQKSNRRDGKSVDNHRLLDESGRVVRNSRPQGISLRKGFVWTSRLITCASAPGMLDSGRLTHMRVGTKNPTVGMANR
jgi:hypothetical protein